MLIRGPDGKLESVDYRETAPAAAYQDMFKDKEAASRSGGLAAGVPGELRGLEYMHKKHGVSTLSLSPSLCQIETWSDDNLVPPLGHRGDARRSACTRRFQP